MKCIVVRTFGSAPEVVGVEERPVPEPGPAQVLIRMRLSPIHRHDLMAIAGRYGSRPALPLVPGTEGFGVVERVGSSCGRFAEGQRVAAMASAVWAEYFVADAAATVPIPDELEDGIAAQLVAMPLSVRLLFRQLAPRPGDWLIFNAAGGTVGRLIAGLAEQEGVRTIGIGRRATAPLPASGNGGRFHVSTQAADWKDRVGEILGRARARHAVDSVGGAAANDLAGFLEDGARLTSFGVLSGRPLEIDAAHLLFRGIGVDGFWTRRQLPQLSFGEVRSAIKGIIEEARRGALPLAVAARYDFASVAAALRSAGGSPAGKVLLGP